MKTHEFVMKIRKLFIELLQERNVIVSFDEKHDLYSTIFNMSAICVTDDSKVYTKEENANKENLTSLDALKKLMDELMVDPDWCNKTEDYLIVERALKALEIIKKYTTKDGIEINFLQFFDFDGSINEEVKKELDLLKEVLL